MSLAHLCVSLNDTIQKNTVPASVKDSDSSNSYRETGRSDSKQDTGISNSYQDAVKRNLHGGV